MTHWWRAYDEALHDPKVLALSDRHHRAWFNLLCVASKNKGILPDIKTVAIELRVSPHKAAEWITALVVAGLIDKTETGFTPHNWGKRQFHSDSSTERVREHRKRGRNVSVTPPETETENRLADAEDARARPLIRSEALTLSDDIALLCGHNLEFVPPAWCGAAMRVEAWLAHGWKREQIIAAVTATLAKRRGRPPDSVNYFEKPIAEFIANNARPLPEVVVDNTPEKVHVRPQANSVIAGADRLVERMQQWDRPIGSGPRSADDVRLLSKG